MTMLRFDALREYWRLNPPVHQLVAAYMDYKPPEVKKTGEPDIAELFKALGGGNVGT